MKNNIIKIGLLVALCAPMSGCVLFKDTAKELKTDVNCEFTQAGGVVGCYANNLLPATTKQMELFRATLIFALISRAGAESLSDSTEVPSFLSYMSVVDGDIKRLANHMQSPDCKTALTTNPLYDCNQLFENDLPRLEGHMFKMAVLALPTKQFQSIESDFVTGAYLKGALALLKVSGVLLSAAHADAATTRSIEEIIQLNKTPMPSNTQPESLKSAVSNVKSIDVTSFHALYNLVQMSCYDLKNKVPAAAVTTIKCSYKYATVPNTSPAWLTREP